MRALNSNDLALIKFFKTKLFNYCYVSHSNVLLQIGDSEWTTLIRDQRQKTLSVAGRKFLAGVLQAADVNYIDPPVSVKFPLTRKEIEDNLENNLTSILLNVTESCNLACDYCIYGGSYIGSRGPSSKEMLEETAIKAIHFFLERTSNTETPIISFYGGEPLLRFGLIQKCIKYALEKSTKSLCFSFTTNGTLLDLKKIAFLKKYNVSVIVSIDGPSAFHDRYRHQKNKKGSHKIIISNLEKINKTFPEFYRNNIDFISIITPDSDLCAIDNYFSENDLFKQNRFIVTSVRTSGSRKYNHFNFITDEINDIYIKHKSSSDKGERVFLKGLFEKSLVRFHERKIWDGYPTKIYPNGMCLPGARKLMITCDGDFKICERVATSKTIGNINDGFDVDAIISFIQEYENLCNPDCIHCWANRMCKMCFSSFYIENIDPQLRKEKCKRLKENIHNVLKRYCEIMEKNPTAFDR